MSWASFTVRIACALGDMPVVLMEETPVGTDGGFAGMCNRPE